MKANSYFFIFFLLFGHQAIGQLNKFAKPAGFADLNTVYEYRKSNWDGTHASSVFLYVSDSNKLESFKWWEGGAEATLVTAIIDWNTYSVSEFQNHKLRKGKPAEFIARLSGQQKLDIEVMGMRDSLVIDALPWQSYDFDFAGLSFVWRALKNKKDRFWFHIADVAMINEQPKFVNKGKVDVKYIGFETVNDKNCLKYLIDGAGLENKGGHAWIDPRTFMIEQYKVALPDEPGFQNGMMQLIRTFKHTPAQWETFKKQKLGD